MEALRNAIEALDYPETREEFEAWKQTTLALLADGPLETNHGKPPHARLSPREAEVMDMLLHGRRLKEIGAKLGISVKTVTTHRARLLRKLGLNDNLGLYRYAIRARLISA